MRASTAALTFQPFLSRHKGNPDYRRQLRGDCRGGALLRSFFRRLLSSSSPPTGTKLACTLFPAPLFSSTFHSSPPTTTQMENKQQQQPTPSSSCTCPPPTNAFALIFLGSPLPSARGDHT